MVTEGAMVLKVNAVRGKIAIFHMYKYTGNVNCLCLMPNTERSKRQSGAARQGDIGATNQLGMAILFTLL